MKERSKGTTVYPRIQLFQHGLYKSKQAALRTLTQFLAHPRTNDTHIRS